MPRPKKLRPPKTHERGWGEGSVREVRPGTWRAFRARVHRPDGSTLRPSRTFQGPQAEALAAQWAKGEPEPTVLLLGVWLSRWLALRRASLDPSTFDHYQRDVLECAPLAGRPLASLTMDDWQLLTNQLLSRFARKTVAVWRGNISVALRAAIPEHLARNPLDNVKLPKAVEQPPRVWRQSEVDRALAAAGGGVHEVWLLFCLGTGVRLGESRALLWADVDLQTRTAVIRQSADNQDGTIGPTKTRKVRVIDFPDEVGAALSEHRKRQPASEVYVFGHGGRPYDSNAPRRWLQLLCRRAGVTTISPHGLRHTYASLALDAGVPVQDVARQLGHTVQTLLRTYAHFLGDGQRRAATAIGAALQHRFSGPKLVDGTQMTRG